MIRISVVRMALTLAATVLGSQLHPSISSLLSGPAPAEAMHAAVEGFGAATQGGTGQPEYRVTSLADSGPGTLRDALSRGNRDIRFAVAGEINLHSQLAVRGSFVTIDGFSAPSPGITLRGFGLNIYNVDEVIVRGIRIRDAAGDAIGLYGDVTNVVIDHVSIHNSGDGGIDISSGPKNITIQWSIVSTGKMMLWGSTAESPRRDTDRISMHHTMLICPHRTGGCDRNPLIRASGYVVRADLRYNVFEGWIRANGTKVEPNGWVNVVGNAYIPNPATTYSQRNSSLAGYAGTRVYTSGNLELGADPRPNLNDNGNESSPMPAPPITQHDLGCVVRDAGMHPRDSVDQRLASYVSRVPAGCADGTPPPTPTPPPPPVTPVPDLAPRSLSAPQGGTPGQSISVTTIIANVGTGPAGGSTARLYLANGASSSAGDFVLASLGVPPLPAGASHTATTNVTLPANATAGSYTIRAHANADGAVAESNQGNNTIAMPIAVTASPGSTGSSTLIPVLIQAESMALTSPMTIGRDAGALGGGYISPTSGANSMSPVRLAAASVTVPVAGTYYLWARMYGPSPTEDALYVGIGSSWDRAYPSTSRSYQWVRIENANGSGVPGFHLSAGTHTIQVGRGETNARLDAVYLTNRADDVPTFASGQ